MNEKKVRKASPVIPILLSVVCAIGLWLYVMSVESPTYQETFTGIPVVLRNSSLLGSSGLSLVSGTGHTVEVTVNGRRSAINKIRPEKIVAYADLANVNAAGEYPLEIMIEPIDGVTVSSLSETTVLVYADITTTKTISISQDIVYHGGVKTDVGYSLGKPRLVPTSTMPDVTSTTIKGPVSALGTVDHACVKAIDVGAISVGANTGSIVYNDAELQLIDENGEVVDNAFIKFTTISDSTSVFSVTVNFPINMEKEIEVEPKFSESYTAADYTISVSPARVKVSGEKSLVNGIDKIRIPLDGSPEAHIGISKLTLPEIEGATLDTSREIELTVKKKEVKVTEPAKK